jgi:hypothetical protein
MEPDTLPPLSAEDIIEELRDMAQMKVDDLNSGWPEKADQIGIPRFRVEDTIEAMAADCIEDLLRTIEGFNSREPK